MTPQTLDLLVNSPDETALNNPLQTVSRPAMGKSNGVPVRQHRDQIQHVPAGSGTSYWGPGERMTFLATGKETGGAFFLAEILIPPGEGPPPHIHRREDESFQILEGTLTLQVGDDTITASAGDFVYLPRGIAHGFKNSGDCYVKALVLTTPAGLEDFFAEVFEPATNNSEAPPVSKELIGKAMAAAPRYGLELLPPA